MLIISRSHFGHQWHLILIPWISHGSIYMSLFYCWFIPMAMNIVGLYQFPIIFSHSPSLWWKIQKCPCFMYVNHPHTKRTLDCHGGKWSYIHGVPPWMVENGKSMKQGLVNVPFWGFWTSLSNICWNSYPLFSWVMWDIGTCTDPCENGW